MSKRRRRARQASRSQWGQVDLGAINQWWGRMRENIEHAVRLSDRLSDQHPGDLGDDLRWGLIKYVENATESIKQLDKLSNKTIFKALSEIPFDGDNGNLSWQNLIKMRDLVAHSFWKIEHDQIQQAMIEDFALLLPYIQTVRIHQTIFSSFSPKESLDFTIDGSELLALPISEFDVPPKPGASLIYLFLTTRHGFGAMRVGRNSKNNLLIATGPDWMRKRTWNLTIYEIPKEPTQNSDGIWASYKITAASTTR